MLNVVKHLAIQFMVATCRLELDSALSFISLTTYDNQSFGALKL
jgi:hypothetical protein